MKKNYFIISGVLLFLFIFWTIAVKTVDVQAIGPNDSTVGLAILNKAFNNLTGNNMMLYIITDWLGIIPIAIMLVFAILGLVQLIKRKSLFKVDLDILILGGFYIIVLIMYILFEYLKINYRPILIDGYLEASYPSSTTLLVMCIMPTALIQARNRISNVRISCIVKYTIIIFTLFMIIGRSISGVHWISDIIGGALLSGGLVMMYCFLIGNKRAQHC